jgi:heat shock protein HslJ
MNPSVLRATASFAVLCLLAACTTMNPTSDSRELDGTLWTLSSLPGHSLVTGATPTLRFEGGRVSGTDGCNRYTAPYTAKGSVLQIGPRPASTMMACPPATMKQADAFVDALTRARAYRITGEQLQLLADDGAVLATFAAQSQSLVGTSWRVSGYNNGRQAVVSVLAGTSLTLAFANDGNVGGSGGCNRYMATYTSQGQKLALGPVAATRKMCTTPDGVMEQEQQFFKALETVATARLEGDRLELRTAEDQLAVTLTNDSVK